ncbi:integrase catalytic region [Clostridium sp. CAG:356]|mgnify:FL=1|nr:integrase catalytic region [Clostridium sp. CAG:356]
MIQCDCQENIEMICKNMCQKDYNKKIEKKKYQHLNYVEKTQIERWYNIEKKACSEIAKLLNKSVRTIQREIKRGMVENLTTQLEIKYVYSADVSEKKYKAEFKDKFKTITFDNRLIRRFYCNL